MEITHMAVIRKMLNRNNKYIKTCFLTIFIFFVFTFPVLAIEYGSGQYGDDLYSAPSSRSSTTGYNPYFMAQQQNINIIAPVVTTPTNLPVLTRTLKLKMTGEDVKQLQIYLNNHNFKISEKGAGSPGFETKYFGLKTKAAIIKFQIANGLVGDGIVGPLTKAKIK